MLGDAPAHIQSGSTFKCWAKHQPTFKAALYFRYWVKH